MSTVVLYCGYHSNSALGLLYFILCNGYIVISIHVNCVIFIKAEVCNQIFDLMSRVVIMIALLLLTSREMALISQVVYILLFIMSDMVILESTSSKNKVH